MDLADALERVAEVPRWTLPSTGTGPNGSSN
jgi:hypothetical protein